MEISPIPVFRFHRFKERLPHIGGMNMIHRSMPKLGSASVRARQPTNTYGLKIGLRIGGA